MKKSVFISAFVLGHAVALILISAIAIYSFDYYEKMYGKGISFQISLWIVAVGALIIGFGFSIGVALSNWVSKFWIGFIAGILFSIFMLGLSLLANMLSNDTGVRQLLFFSSWFLCSLLLPIVVSKIKTKLM